MPGRAGARRTSVPPHVQWRGGAARLGASRGAATRPGRARPALEGHGGLRGRPSTPPLAPVREPPGPSPSRHARVRNPAPRTLDARGPGRAAVGLTGRGQLSGDAAKSWAWVDATPRGRASWEGGWRGPTKRGLRRPAPAKTKNVFTYISIKLLTSLCDITSELRRSHY